MHYVNMMDHKKTGRRSRLMPPLASQLPKAHRRKKLDTAAAALGLHDVLIVAAVGHAEMIKRK